MKFAFFYVVLFMCHQGTRTKIMKAFLNYENLDYDGVPWEAQHTLKKAILKPGQELREMTICTRTYSLAYNKNGLHTPFLFHDGIPLTIETNGDTELIGKSMASDMFAPGVHPYDFVTWMWSSRRGYDKTKNEWSFMRKSKQGLNAQEWHHVCHVYSVPKKNTGIVFNGEIVANRTQSKFWANEDNFYSSRSFEPYQWQFELDDGIKWSRGFGLLNNGPLFGYLTDVQIWDQALSYEEMVQITTCKSFAEGNLLPWNIDDWTQHNTEFNLTDKIKQVEVDSQLFCPKQSRYLYFPGTNAGTFESLPEFCQMFGGEVVNTTTKEQVVDASAFFNDLWDNPNWPKREWQMAMFLTLWNDIEMEGNWTHVDLSQPPPDITWHLTEPNGEIGENCLQYTAIVTNRGSENEKLVLVGRDYSCKGKFAFLCENTRKFTGIIYGLCKETYFDTIFLLSQTPSGIEQGSEIRRFFSGNFGWKMAWDNDQRLWKLASKTTNETFATQADTTYPLGRKQWTVYNDKCNTRGGSEVMFLTFSPCREDEFTCDSGNCVPMEKRCDQKEDCKDVSDEKNCLTVVVDPKKYLKDKPPPALLGEEKTELKVKVDLIQILTLSVVEMKITTKYNLYLEWVDPRITFYNLKENKNLNGLVQSEIEKIWIPKIIFANTQSNKFSSLDEKSIGQISRKGSYTRSTIDEKENIYKFKGATNPVLLSRVYETEWICEYDMRWYPFDTQWCTMQFKTTEDLGIFVQLAADSHIYSGPTELTQYFVRGTRLYMQTNENGLVSVVLEISLGRRLTATFLTAFLPTILLNVIGHATNYFKTFFFEAVVTVNLTVMLVLTTMFINISSLLPVTSYVKMIDLWLIFNLIIPFCEVLLHTYKDMLRDEGREVNHHGTARKFDADGNEIIEDAEVEAADSNRVEPIKIVDSDNGGFDLKLISRKEDTQVKALQDYYSNVKTLRVKRLELLDNIGHVVIPRIALSFVALFWTIGLTKYSTPDFTVDWILDFITSPLVILGIIVLVIFILLISFCYSRCFKR